MVLTSHEHKLEDEHAISKMAVSEYNAARRKGITPRYKIPIFRE